MITDADWWAGQFTLDGIKPAIAHVIQRAAEGIAAAIMIGDENPDYILSAREILIDLSDKPENWTKYHNRN